jgi:chemotaxis protein MotB
MSWRADQHEEHEEESFFVSMSDIMVGLLFIFIILVVFFVLQIRIEASKVVELETELGREQGETSERDQLDQYRSRTANQRTEILEGLKSFFAREGFTEVEIDTSNGVLRFPDGVLFASGQYDFREGTRTATAVSTLADALAEVLPCSVLMKDGVRYRSRNFCRPGMTEFHNSNDAFVEAVYIEGHTDNDTVLPGGLKGDRNLNSNLKLSARRATNTYERVADLRSEVPTFYGLTSVGEVVRVEPAIAVSGYGEQRPIADNAQPGGKNKNRRIDVRIVMYQPYDYKSLNLLLKRLGVATIRKPQDEVG